MSNRVDTFDRADNALGLGTPSDAGSDWVQIGSSFLTIVSNRCLSATAGAEYLESSTSDIYNQLTIITKSTADGLFIRATDGSNYILMNTSGGQYYLWRYEAAGYNLLDGPAGTAADGDVWKLEGNGSALKGYINAVQILTGTDSFNLTATKHGIWSNASGGIYDDYSCTDIGAPPAVPAVLLAGARHGAVQRAARY